MSSVVITRLQIEHLRETLGIGTDHPRLSWQIETSIQNWQQTSFEIECFSVDGTLRGQTGRIESNQSVLVDWQFAPLHSRERVSLRVRVWGTDGSASDWSEPATVEAGLLYADDWSAQFINSA
jgi:alpha-L-rhamnosidase